MRRDGVMPLSEFDDAHLRRIMALVALPTPPERWLSFGSEGSPPLCQMESRAWWEWHWARGLDPDRVRQKLAPWLREFVIERDGLVCQLCGLDVERSDIHIDHIHPVSKGGSNDTENLQVTHSQCNLRKAARV